MNLFRIILVFLTLLNLSCVNKNPIQQENIKAEKETGQESHFSSILSAALTASNLPKKIADSIQEGYAADPAFILDLFHIMQDDPYIWILVDKEHPLAQDYEPEDLIELRNSSYRINRDDLKLREKAQTSLEKMAAAAQKEGLSLLASSAYRSYSYQAQIYERNVRTMGQQEADRESASPGHSQHQLGLVVDFGSITDNFARTAEGMWLSVNASRFGWSLSYPEGYEEITGYRWESWHYRYTGTILAEFIENYFEGIQQYALNFIHEFKKLTDYPGTF
jgi:D-alanyl-D-alanine carboxypeptidase